MNNKYLTNEKSRIINSIIIIVAPLLIGIMNTFLIKEEDIGSWKNYIGYILLFLGIMNLVMAIATSLSNNLKIKARNIIFKIIALVIPFYFIYYWPLHEKQSNKEVKILWKYIFLGFAIYTVLIVIIIIRNV